MAFRHKFYIERPAIPVYPSASTIGGLVTSTCIGYLCVTESTVASVGPTGMIPIASTGDFMKIIGIVSAVPEDTTQSSTTPFYVTPILPGDFVEAEYSTTVERSTGATSVIAATNVHRYLGIGTGTGKIGFYLDPSLASTSPGTTNAMIFRLLGFSTQNDKAWGTINSSHLIW